MPSSFLFFDFLCIFAVKIDIYYKPMVKSKPLNEYRTELKPKIVECAGQLFAQNGIRAVNMEMLSKKLGISKRTIYELFADKEELVKDCIQALHNDFHNHMQAYASVPHNAIEIISEFFIYQINATSKFSQKFFDDMLHYPAIHDFFQNNCRKRDSYAAAFFARGVEEGFFRDDVDYEIVTRVGALTLNAIMSNSLYNEYPMDSILRNVPILFVRGLCTPKGIEQLDRVL